MKTAVVQKSIVGVGVFVALFALQSGMALAATTASLFPVGEGINLAWTPSAGVAHYTMVDETTCNGVTDYVSETTVGDRDSYQVSLATVPTGAVITGVAITPCASRNSTGGGSSMFNVFYRLNGAASADAGAYSLPTGTTPIVRSTTTFSGLTTTKNASTTLEVGAVYATGTKGVRLSNLATVVTYIVKPTAPINLAVIATTSPSLGAVLSWTDTSTTENGFEIARSLDGVSFGLIATTTANVIKYTNYGIATGTYYYKVRALNIAGPSAYSSTTVITL
jgi:hypothetical protein